MGKDNLIRKCPFKTKRFQVARALNQDQRRVSSTTLGCLLSELGYRPEESLLYGIVEQHADAFFAHLGERDAMLPGVIAGVIAR